MDKWIKAIKACYSVGDGLEENSGLGFSILDGGSANGASQILGSRDMVAFGWSNGGDDFLMASGIWEPSKKEELQDRLEEIFDKLIGRTEANLYAARDVIVDDMEGIEVCGGVEFEDGVETIVYVLYLSDEKEGFCTIGLGSGEAEMVFDELSGLARTFYRKPYPATVVKGKNFSPIMNAIRNLAIAVIPQKNARWNIVNTTFEVDGGKFINKPSVILITKDNVEACDPEDVFGEKDFSEIVSELTSVLPDIYDISGFTITNFSDGRYGITYYPVFDGDEGCECGEGGCDCGSEHDHEHGHKHGDGDCKCSSGPKHAVAANLNDDEDVDVDDEDFEGDIADLEPVLKEMGVVMAGAFDGGWKHGMGLITSDGEYFSLAVFYSDGGSLVSPEIPEALDIKLSEMINDLGDTLEEGYPGWNAFGFAFEKDDSSDDVDETSVRYEVFDFNIYLDATDDEQDDENDYLLPAADLFYEEMNESDICVSAVTFKIIVGEDGPFVVEPATASTPDGIIHVKSFDNSLPKIFTYAEELFTKNPDSNTVSVTLFPGGKVGFSLEYTEEPIIVNRQNLPMLLEEVGIAKYEGHIKRLSRNEILARVYEVDAEESLLPGVSKVGGSPWLPEGTVWPLDDNNKSMSFVAQVNLREIAPFDRQNLLPEEGVLTFFYSDTTSGCKVILSTVDDTLEPIEPDSEVEYVEEFLPARLRFVPSVSLPVTFASDEDKTLEFLKTEEEEEAYADIAVSVGKTKMFGYADVIQTDIESMYDKPVKLLLQLPSLEQCDMHWGDAGTVYFWIFEEDLKAGRFDKCWCVMQSY